VPFEDVAVEEELHGMACTTTSYGPICLGAMSIVTAVIQVGIEKSII